MLANWLSVDNGPLLTDGYPSIPHQRHKYCSDGWPSIHKLCKFYKKMIHIWQVNLEAPGLYIVLLQVLVRTPMQSVNTFWQLLPFKDVLNQIAHISDKCRLFMLSMAWMSSIYHTSCPDVISHMWLLTECSICNFLYFYPQTSILKSSLVYCFWATKE